MKKLVSEVRAHLPSLDPVPQHRDLRGVQSVPATPRGGSPHPEPLLGLVSGRRPPSQGPHLKPLAQGTTFQMKKCFF